MTKRCPHSGRPAAYKARVVISSRSFGPEPRGRAPERRLPCRGFKQGQLLCLCNERRSVVRSFSPKLSNLDLSAKFHHLSRGHAEEGCRAFGVVLQKCEESLAPDCHAHDFFTRDDLLAANIIGDICGIDAAYFSLIAGGLQSCCDRDVAFHEAEVENDACNSLDHFNHFHPVLVGDTRRLLDKDSEEYNTLVHHVIVPDELRQRERHAIGRVCKKNGGT